MQRATQRPSCKISLGVDDIPRGVDGLGCVNVPLCSNCSSIYPLWDHIYTSFHSSFLLLKSPQKKTSIKLSCSSKNHPLPTLPTMIANHFHPCSKGTAKRMPPYESNISSQARTTSSSEAGNSFLLKMGSMATGVFGRPGGGLPKENWVNLKKDVDRFHFWWICWGVHFFAWLLACRDILKLLRDSGRLKQLWNLQNI